MTKVPYRLTTVTDPAPEKISAVSVANFRSAKVNKPIDAVIPALTVPATMNILCFSSALLIIPAKVSGETTCRNAEGQSGIMASERVQADLYVGLDL